jgi:ribosome-binding protein aMBF1 (putative translation factor)
MSYAQVCEIAAALHAPKAPRGAKAAARALGDELCRPRSRPRAATWNHRLDRLLAVAVRLLRDAMARDLRAARRCVGASRKDMAARIGRTISYVARAERGEAAFDLAMWLRVRSLAPRAGVSR